MKINIKYSLNSISICFAFTLILCVQNAYAMDRLCEPETCTGFNGIELNTCPQKEASKPPSAPSEQEETYEEDAGQTSEFLSKYLILQKSGTICTCLCKSTQ